MIGSIIVAVIVKTILMIAIGTYAAISGVRYLNQVEPGKFPRIGGYFLLGILAFGYLYLTWQWLLPDLRTLGLA